MSPIESLKTHSKFKKTEIGEIPVDWELVKLRDICSLNYGKGLPEDERMAGPYPVYGSNGIVGYHNERLVIGPGIIVGRKGTVGCVTWSDKDFWPIDTTFYLTWDDTRADARYLYYQLQKMNLERLNISTGVPGLNRDLAGNTGCPLPSMKEQNKIEKILSTVDAAIEKMDAVIEKIKQLKKSLMDQLLTRGIGHTKFKKSQIGQIPNEWNIIELGEIAKIRYGLGQPPQLDPEGVPMIRATNVKSGKISKEGLIRVLKHAIPKNRNPYLAKGDIIVVRSGAYTGDIGLVTEEWENAIAGYDLVVSLKEHYDPLFYANFLLSPFGQKFFSSQKDRSAQPHLNEEQLSSTLVLNLPLSEQRQISKIFEVVDHDIEIQKSHKNMLHQLKESLMSILLTGKVRVEV